MIPGNPDFVGVITNVVADQGGTEVGSEFADASNLVRELREASGGIFEVVDSGSGDRCRIVPNSGQLQLLDNDGLIRIAKRLENTQQFGDCIQQSLLRPLPAPATAARGCP